MRNAFVNKLMEHADENTFLLIGDVGYFIFDPFLLKHSGKILNVGIAEQNMTGIAAGMSREGFKVFTYSIGNFNTLRCLEQVRNDICYHNLDVTIVSAGGGMAYGSAGYSHHAVQDICSMGSLPNMTLLLPGDPREVEFCLQHAFHHVGPKYLRLGKSGEASFHGNSMDVKKINKLKGAEQDKIALFSVSTMLSANFEIAGLLAEKGINCSVFSCPIIDQDFKDDARKTLEDFDHVFTLEEHISDFGFGTIVKNALEDMGKQIRSFGLKKDSCKWVGSRDYLCEQHEIGPKQIVTRINEILNS